MRCAKERLDRAEVAAESTATSELDKANRQVTLTLKDGAIRRDSQLRSLFALIKRLGAAVAIIINDLFEESFCFTDDKCVSVLTHLFRAKRRMKPAHHNRHTALTIFAGNLVSAFGGVGFYADGNQVCRFIKRDWFKAIIVEFLFDIGRRQSGNHRCRKTFHLPGSDVLLHASWSTNARMHDRESKWLSAAHESRISRETRTSSADVPQPSRRAAGRSGNAVGVAADFDSVGNTGMSQL